MDGHVGRVEGGTQLAQPFQGRAQHLPRGPCLQPVLVEQRRGDGIQVARDAAQPYDRVGQQGEGDRVLAQRRGPGRLPQIARRLGRGSPGRRDVAAHPRLQAAQRVVDELGAGRADHGGLLVAGPVADQAGHMLDVLVGGLGGGHPAGDGLQLAHRFARPGAGRVSGQCPAEADVSVEQAVVGLLLALVAPVRPAGPGTGTATVPGPAQRPPGEVPQCGGDQRVVDGEGDRRTGGSEIAEVHGPSEHDGRTRRGRHVLMTSTSTSEVLRGSGRSRSGSRAPAVERHQNSSRFDHRQPLS